MTTGMQSIQGDKPFIPAEPLFKPGTHFHYGDDLNMMAYVLTHIAHEPLHDLFKRRIADPIGLSPAKWHWDDWGNVDSMLINGGSGTNDKGMHISARELARVGYLFLNNGAWQGKQLISVAWVKAATQPQTDTSITAFDKKAWYTGIIGAYGYNFWVNGIRPGGKRLWQEAPVNTFAIQGHNNSHCIMIPEWDIVVVRLGDDNDIDEQLYNGFFARIKASILE
jgi:CubicO group peptidase (beta-lactamase class C family)